MKTMWFAGRCGKEILRDKLNLAFGIGFPVILLLLLSAINASIPTEAGMTLFELPNLTPGVAVFGLSFFSLFSALLIAKDRESAFMMRLLTSPLSAAGFIMGYTLPLLPMAMAQTALCYLVAMLLGLSPTVNILMAILINIPAALFFIGVGLLCGTLMGTKQVGGICGALLTNLSAWLSGTWFDTALVGGVFEGIANVLPFVHAVKVGRHALAGEFAGMFPDFWWVLGYAVLMLAVATSIDALAVGITFAFLKVNILSSILIIGLTTFALSFAAVYLGSKLGDVLKRYAGILGGVILIVIGTKILIEHLFF